MRVLFLTHSFPRFPGDIPGSFVLRLAVALRNEDVDVRVIAPSAEGLARQEEIDGIRVDRFRYAPRRFETLAYSGNMVQDVSASWTARAALGGFLAAELGRAVKATRDFRADVIHAHWWFPSGVIARWAAAARGKPFVTTIHGTDLRMADRVAASRPMFRGVMRHSARVTAVSTWLADRARSLAPGVYPVVAPMPVATERFSPGMSREANRFLFAGRLNAQKGLDHLLRAVAAMERSAMLDVVGEGNDRQALRLLASQLGISDRVVWHGQVDQAALTKHYQSATAVVVPSTDEGLGLVAVEALLCEAPVVAFKSGGLIDVIQHDATGILVTPGDTADLARALDAVVANPDRAGTLGRAGRIFAMSSFSPRSAARTYAGLYADVLAERAT